MHFYGTRRGESHTFSSWRHDIGQLEEEKGLQVLHIHLERKAGMGPMKGRLTFGKQPEKFVSTCVENRAETISIRGGTIVAGEE